MNFIIITFLIIQNYAFSTSSSSNSYQYERPQSTYYQSNKYFDHTRGIDENFQSQIITLNVEIKWRTQSIPSCHPDIIFSLQDSIEILVLSFNQNALRYDATRLTIKQFQQQAKDIYESTVWASLKKPLSVLKVLLIADRVVQQDYKNFIDKCEESARYFIDQLKQ
ncbi:unnamed protein product [Paramecium octaurelia]|uniref:Uncharacterized protein n=1 Tax=Paramecium octaurelia TaxID=43137 RepID=A0A8S1V118_PAROT|nr:unnamed protein product [Paramecium octaurelia]